MRILHLDAGKEMRGGQWQVLRLIEGLAAQGAECTLLARPGFPLYECAKAKGCPVDELSFKRMALQARHHDLMHAHDARSHTFAALMPAIRFVVSRRVAFPPGSRWKYGRACHFLAVSEYVKSVLKESGIPEERVTVVYDGVPLLEPSIGARILTPASDDELKGAPLALEAAKQAGVPITLSTDLERDLRDSGIFVYISRTEGLGSAALLAMSAGVPVIASRVGGLPEAVQHERTGLLVENTVEAIAAAIARLAGNPELARQYGRAGRQEVEQKFTVDRMVRNTMEVYRQVLQ